MTYLTHSLSLLHYIQHIQKTTPTGSLAYTERNTSMVHRDGDGVVSLTTAFLSEKDLEISSTRLQHPNNTYQEGSSTFSKTCFNGINALSGVGILSVPYALASGGWLSLAFLFTIAVLSFYTGLLMRRCMDLDSNIRTYPDIGGHAFGHIGRSIVSIFMYLELYFVATGFLILEGDNLTNLFPGMDFQLGWIRISGREGFVIIVALIILPSMWLADLSMLSYVSATGVVASIVIIGSVFWIGVVDGISYDGNAKVFDPRGIPTAISLYAFCFCGHPVFPTLYTSMKDKGQFRKVLLLCFFVCTIGYALMAIMGYLIYGEDVLSQVTLNLPTERISSKIAICTTLVNPVTKYALMMTPIVAAIESHFNCVNYNTHVNLLIRTMVLISTVVVALAVPFFCDLMSLVGAFLSATASFILPCICYLKISETYRKWGGELLIILGIIAIGIAIVITGTYTALIQIFGHL